MPRKYQRNRGKQRAQSPYNFVPITQYQGDMTPYKPLPAERGLVDHDMFYDELNCGYFTVDLTPKTPLFIRGMLTRAQALANEQQRKKSKDDSSISTSDFFSYDGDAPVIPGSSLRGMIRSLVEIITCGKMHFVGDNPKIFFRAVAAKHDDPQGRAYKRIMGNPQPGLHAGGNIGAGFLLKRNGKWYVHPAEPFDDMPFALVPDKHEVVKDVTGIKQLNRGNYQIGQFPVNYAMGKNNKARHVYTPTDLENAEAVLVCTGNMAETQSKDERIKTGRKNFVLVKQERGKSPRLINETTIRDYLDGLSPFQTDKNDQTAGFFDPDNGLLKEGRVVFFIEEDGEVTRFGHAPNFRIAHFIDDESKRAVTPRDRVPNILLNPNFVDYADAMFGYVSEDDEQNKRTPKAYAGRISVTSAFPTNDEYKYHDGVITPRVLGGPKPTTFQHYLEQPDAATSDKSALTHYGHDDAIVRGHKLYWRQNIRGVKQIINDSEDIKENVSTEIRPLVQGNFEFKVHFDNLTDSELGALAWALTLGGDDSAHHMLGMGKPHGMGVIKLSAQLTLINRKTRYSQLFNGHEWAMGEDKDTNIEYYIRAFKNAINTHTGQAFDSQWRIRQLQAMLRLQPKHNDFAYMELEDFKDRPVLPYPTELIDKS